MDKEYTITINFEQLRLITRLLKDYELEARADVRACEELNMYNCLKVHERRLGFVQRLLGQLPSTRRKLKERYQFPKYLEDDEE